VWVPDFEDPEGEYQKVLDALHRSLHNVTCTSGPLIEEKLHRADTWGYIVEFTLVAATPWLFGITKPVVIPPSLPVVVQDVPYNLMPHPSAELSEGTVIVATNLVTNPSGESGTTGWAYALGGGMSGSVAITQTNELAAVGTYSIKAAITLGNTGSGGALALDLPVALPGLTPTTRYSVNLWSAASVQSGTAVLGDLTYQIMWQDAGGAGLRTDTFGTATSSGGAKSEKSILPPAGTVKAVLRAHQAVNSYSAGAIIRLYADAAAVTVP
jgi:hypothetical protein